MNTYEPKSKQQLAEAFEANFGFKPPKSIKEIKFQQREIYDTTIIWLAFTNDLIVLEKILRKDESLQVMTKKTPIFHYTIENIKETYNIPKWFKFPSESTQQIHFKKDFLNHNFSEYYLWMDPESEMTYLYIHYFD